MTIQKFLNKIEETKMPIKVRKVLEGTAKTQAILYIVFPDGMGRLAISSASVSDIEVFHIQTINNDSPFWRISFSKKRFPELTIMKPVNAMLTIPKSSPDFQSLKNKWEGWNC